MTVKEAYILVQQGLQNLNAFVYPNFRLPELDVDFNRVVNAFVESSFVPKENRQARFENIQAEVDDLRVLELKDQNITPLVTFSQGKYIAFPSNYLHLLNDKTVYEKTCVENGVTVVRDIISPNRLTKTVDLPNILENSLGRTSKNSPVSNISGSNLYVYSNSDFTIKAIYIDYLKKPATVAYGADGSSTLEFPDMVCYKIIDYVVQYISVTTQQSQQKIQNLPNVTVGKL